MSQSEAVTSVRGRIATKFCFTSKKKKCNECSFRTESDESLYVLKWDFVVNPLLSYLTDPIIEHVSGNLAWSIYLPIYRKTHQSPGWSLGCAVISAPPHTTTTSVGGSLQCERYGMLSVFDPHGGIGQGVLFELAAIMVIGWHLERCRGELVRVLNKQGRLSAWSWPLHERGGSENLMLCY